MKQVVLVAALAGVIGGGIAAVVIRAAKSPTPAALSSRLDSAERKITTILVHDAETESDGAWMCTPSQKCGRTDAGCAPKCERRKIAYCGGLFGVDCYERLESCLARVEELQRAHDLDARMCIGVQ